MGEPVHRVADHLGVRDLGHPGPDPVDQRVLAGVDLVALGHHRLERGRGAQCGRDVLEAGHPLVDPVVVGERVAPTGRPCGPAARRRRPGRPTCAPTRRPPTSRSGSGSRPIEAQASMNRGTPSAQLELADRLEGADLVVGALEGDGRDVGPDCVLDQVDRRRRARRPSRRRRPTRHPRRARAARRSARPASGRPPRSEARTSPSRPRCTASVPEEVNDTSSRRTPRASATASRALSRISRASRAGPCSRRGSAYPRSSAASIACRAAGCSGSEDAVSRYTLENYPSGDPDPGGS